MGTAAASSFTDELQRWHKQLQTVEAVLQVWVELQGLWVQLEEFYSSSEVAQHLPTPHFVFSTVDKEWKELMAATARNPSLLSTCLKEGINCMNMYTCTVCIMYILCEYNYTRVTTYTFAGTLYMIHVCPYGMFV